MKYIHLSQIENKFDYLILLINSEKFLSGSYHNTSEIIISDQDDAITFATDQDVDYLKGADYRDWTHILEDQDSVYKLLQSKNRFQGEEDFMAIYNKHYEKLNIILFDVCRTVNLSNFLMDCLSAQFYNIFSSSIIYDELPSFSKKLLLVLENGGFPCGWKGDFPEGQLIVYNHKRKE